MHPSISPGEVRTIHQHEKEVLCHIGYQIRNMSGCTLPTPIANNDVGTINSSMTDIPFLGIPFYPNDYSFSGGDSFANLTLNSIEVKIPTVAPNITYWDNVTVDAGGTVTCGGQPTSLTSAKCMRVPTPTSAPILKIIYTVKDTISNRISLPASILYNRCVIPTQDEHVCNGTFEMGGIGYNPPPYTSTTITFQSGLVPFWKNSGPGSPDLGIKAPAGAPGVGNGMPVPFSGFQDGSIYGAFLFPWSHTMEAVSTKLRAPLVVGQCYRIYFQGSKKTNWGAINQDPVKVKLSTNDILGQASLTGLYEPFSEVIPNSPTSSLAWHNYQKYFIPSQPFEYLAIQTPYYTSGNTYVFMDNISLKKVNQSFCTTNSISGIVYNDLNINGSYNPGENGVGNVPVGLFDSNTGALLDQVFSGPNGFYQFYVVNPAPNYYIALYPETPYQMITEPVVNNIFSGYTHTRVVPFAGGVDVTGENFGILLQGQQPSFPPITLTSSTTNTCQANSGAINLTVAGGVPPFTYSWNNGQSTEDISGLAAGTYTVTVTDSATPAQTANLSVTVPPYSVLAINGVVTPTSTGGNIDITATGLAPLYYNWSNGSTTEDLTNVPPGTYTVIVADTNKCTQSATFTIVSQAQSGPCCKIKPNANPLLDCSDPIMNFGNSTVEYGHNRCVAAGQGNSCYWDFSNPACCYPGAQGCGSSSGTTCAPPAQSIQYPFSILNVSTPGYSQLLQSCMTQAQSSSNPQAYYCCVTLPGNLNLTATAKPSCSLNASSIDLSVSGGTAPYTYSWSNGATTQDITNLAPGNYTVNVTSANGLTGSLTVNVQAIAPVTITGYTSLATLPNFNNGAINITVTPSVGYTYNWFKVGGGWPGSTTEDIQNLTPGSYTVTATNSFGCKASKTFKIIKMMKIIGPKETIKTP
jgi:hypothetical protein